MTHLSLIVVPYFDRAVLTGACYISIDWVHGDLRNPRLVPSEHVSFGLPWKSVTKCASSHRGSALPYTPYLTSAALADPLLFERLALLGEVVDLFLELCN